MIRHPPSSITITAKDVDTLDDVKKHLEERANAQANAQAKATKESEREFFLGRLPLDQPINKKDKNSSHASANASTTSDFISKRRRLASEAESASQRRIARLERTTGGHATAAGSSSAPTRRTRQP